MTDRERVLIARDIRTDTLTNVKKTIHAILIGAAGVQQHQSRIFGLNVKGNVDTLIFVPTLRLDLASHTFVQCRCVRTPPRSGPREKGREDVVGDHRRLASCGAVG